VSSWTPIGQFAHSGPAVFPPLMRDMLIFQPVCKCGPLHTFIVKLENLFIIKRLVNIEEPEIRSKGINKKRKA
jgi:hypothetical protein